MTSCVNRFFLIAKISISTFIFSHHSKIIDPTLMQGIRALSPFDTDIMTKRDFFQSNIIKT